MTLEDDLRKLADLRDEFSKLDGEFKASREKWLEDNAELIMKRSVLSDKIDSLEKAILKCGGEFPLEDMASYYGMLYCETCYEKVIENE